MSRITLSDIACESFMPEIDSELPENQDEYTEYDVATESFTGGVASLIAMFIPGVGFFMSPATRAVLKQKEKELESLTKDLRKISVDAGKKAVAEGKMSSEDFKKLETIDVKDFLVGALIQFIPFYNVYKVYTHGSDLEDTLNDIKKVKKEIDDILKKAAEESKKKGS